MRLSFTFLAPCAALAVAAAQVQYQPVIPQALLPDGTAFMSWCDQTQYSRTYHVNQNHPLASDENPGTEARPFRTINRAARILKPGERVFIHAGVYRELVRPHAAGEGPDRMIAYEGAPGDEVVIKGSRILTGRWERSLDPHDQANASGGRNLFSKKLWMTTLPDSLFDNGYFPFRTPNIGDEDLDLMSWALRWKGRIPYSLPRGLLFQQGRRLSQLATHEDLVRLPGSYWVAPDGKTVHIHPYGGGDPNEKLFEAAVQPHIFRPEAPGMGFIRVSGLIFEQYANGLPRVGVGALYTMGGHHWIVERNTVRHVNSVGIEVGYRTFESGDRRFAPRTDTCGWQDAQFHWEVADIKLLVNRGTLVRDNHVARIQGGEGIWLDWDDRNSRSAVSFR